MVGRDLLVTPVLTPNVTTVDGGPSRDIGRCTLAHAGRQVYSLEEAKSPGGTGGRTVW